MAPMKVVEMHALNAYLHFEHIRALQAFEFGGCVEDINAAVNIAEQAFAILPESYPGHDAWLTLLIRGIVLRIIHIGPGNSTESGSAVRNDIDVAFALQELLVCTYRTKLNSATSVLEGISSMSYAGSQTGFEEAMQLFPQSQGSPSNVSLLFKSQLLLCQYRTTETIKDLDEAIALAAKAERGSDALPEGLERMRLIHLARCLSQRYDETGDISNLNEATEHAKVAYAEVKNKQHGSSWVTEKLVHILQKRFERLGRIEDLDEAVLKAEEAESLLPPIEARQRAQLLTTLADVIAYRAIATSNSEGFSQAIVLMGQALQQTTIDEDQTNDYRFALGTHHMQKFFSGAGDVSDLNEAENIFKTNAERGLRNKAELGDLLLERLFITAFARERLAGWSDNGLVDLESMRSRYSPNKHSIDDLPKGVHYSIGVSFHRRYLAQDTSRALRAWEPSKIRILDKAAFHLEKSRPEGLGNIRIHDVFTARNTLGAVYMDKHFLRDKTSEPSGDSDTALEHFRAVANATDAEPFLRVHSARRAIILMTKTGKLEEAVELADQTIDILPKLCSRSLNREDQQRNAGVPGLVSDACALALQKGDVEEALRRAELGRCMTLGYLMDGRRDISELEKKHPDIAEKYDRLRFQAHRTVSQEEDTVTQHRRIQQRQNATKELDKLEAEIRKLETFEDFLRPMTTQDCQKEAKNGPIVLVNMTSFRSDAIIVTESKIIHLKLDDMKSEAPISMFENDNMYRRRNIDSRGEIIGISEAEIEINERVRNGYVVHPKEVNMAEWLWSTCVKLVIEQLSVIPDFTLTEKTRVWWIGMGLASSLPFGAASIQNEGGRVDPTQDCLTRVISSYIPTIKALNYARTHSRLSITKDEGLSNTSMLMVAMPTTPLNSSLSGVQQETQAVSEVMRKMEILQHPSAFDVLKAMKQHQIAHFACHGSSDSRDPSRSHLLLRCKNEYYGKLGSLVEGKLEYRVDRLEVSDLLDSQKDSPSWMAYLSACSTAEVRSAHLREESIHLVNAFQVSGFRHVIGALWRTGDQICAQAAEVFYDSLERNMRNDPMMDSDFAVAKSLRDATVSIRKTHPMSFEAWAAYIHSGA